MVDKKLKSQKRAVINNWVLLSADVIPGDDPESRHRSHCEAVCQADLSRRSLGKWGSKFGLRDRFTPN